MNVGKRIKERRKSLGMSAEDVAEMIHVSPATVYRYESEDIKNMRTDKLVPIASALSTTPAYLMGWTDNPTLSTPSESSAPLDHPDILAVSRRTVPLLGEIACGEPIYADEDYATFAAVDADIDCDFALRCKGDSMIGARIYDGDIVFIKKRDYVDDGTIAAVLIDDDATLKRVYHLSDGRLELRAENPKYRPIIVGGENSTSIYRILGKAVAFQSTII